ncbi:hypothetical protein EJD97_018617 [Solanum chilense]|uniref:Uncharacterized protein n=1 Tax=Solanum chilense TaxID=4083 RepID=A0A6N2B340_SOLCI|nr:hypothetical protein EJD97_018617 [Solanum chilense]
MEVGLAVGGAFISSALNVLFDRLAPEGELLKMFQKHTDGVQLLEKLEDTLLGLQIVLSDAENKQASNRLVRKWLNKLRSAAESAENLIEQVNYEALRLKVEGQHQNLAETSNQQVSDLNLCLSDDFFLKLEDTIKKLEVLEKQIGRLGLKEHFGSTKQETRTPSTSLVDESDIFGRHKEIKDLIDRLLSEDASAGNLTVVTIVGMGGAGKTTLAKAVYNDDKVKNHFGLKAWCCVSEAYDALRITKGLLQEIGSFDSKDDGNLNKLQVKLKEGLKGKKFLVVLDDVWNDNYNEWDDLRNIFVQGDLGSKIIVTTRKENVALMMGSGAINVGTLSSEASWALFKRHSLENREVGRKIADKCKGLPLALKALAGILLCKSEVNEWTNILRSEIWELPSCLKGILPTLMLSYNDLPAHLKQCFAYCAIYPKGHPFCKDQVIHLWIANGLVQQFHSGNQYFLELRSISLFERVPMSERKPEGFLMHDLVNDMAQIASLKLCIRLEENEGSHMLEQSRHMSYSMRQNGEFEKLKPLSKSEQLRTLLHISYSYQLSTRALHNILPRLTSLRALSLSSFAFLDLPEDLFIKLKLVRFLDLSLTKIKRLPDSICTLYNLETLLLSYMPLHLSKLKSLQVLVGAMFHIGGSGGLRMEDLGEVHNLGSCAKDSQTERSILDGLRPYTSIKEVEISGYRGTKFPNWLADLSFLNLVKLVLWCCVDCDSLPALGQLSSLKILIIRSLHGITEVTEEFYGISSSKKPFNSLEKLEFHNMLEWKQWHVLGSGEFPKLEKVLIENCPELTGKFPENLCSLTELKISGCPQLNLDRSQLEGMKKIVEISIRDCNSVTSLPFSILPSSLKRITISGCQKLKLVEPVGYCNMFLQELILRDCDSIDLFLPRARRLRVEHCHNLTRFLIPTEIERLHIFSCENIEKLSVAFGGTQMTSLHIVNCEKLKWLPERMQELLPSLKQLALWNCPEIESFPQGGLPFNLQQLKINECTKLVNSRKEWCLQRLTELVIRHDGSDEEIQHWELPSSIQRLEVSNLKTLSSQVLKSLTSLQYLRVESNIPSSLVEQGGLPSSLSELHLYDHDELHSLHLSHLTSIIRLHISYCHNLQSLSESALPSSLSELTIFKCPKLQSLPVKGMPSSLSKLTISLCPLLTPLLEFDKGEYWQNIAQIPIICIDDIYQ